MTEIKLTQRHTDAGIDYQIGDVITVDPTTARWLINLRIGVENKAEAKAQIGTKAKEKE